MVGVGAHWVYFAGTFPPRECGIATFTKDLTDAFDANFAPNVKSKIIAMNENSVSTYNYPKKVHIQIDESDRDGYLNAAERVNKCARTKIVNIQHEFGIFGGHFGDYLIPFVEEIKKPSVVTFHSVLPDPEMHRKYVVRKLVKNTDKAIAISGFGREILVNDYGIPDRKITVIPHGIPNIAFGRSKDAKKNLGLENRTVISTFGLISKNKGVEYVIKAMPEIVEKHPDALYLVIGETHPVVRRDEGEKYRNRLKGIIDSLRMKNNVKFYNKYLTLDEIVSYLQATDIYITPYQNPDQISSGTLAYAVGAGKACISTPFLYAKDVLRHGRGIVVPFRGQKKIAENINMLLGNSRKKSAFERRAYKYSRGWVWPKVAESYMNLFNQIIKGKE